MSRSLASIFGPTTPQPLIARGSLQTTERTGTGRACITLSMPLAAAMILLQGLCNCSCPVSPLTAFAGQFKSHVFDWALQRAAAIVTMPLKSLMMYAGVAGVHAVSHRHRAAP